MENLKEIVAHQIKSFNYLYHDKTQMAGKGKDGLDCGVTSHIRGLSENVKTYNYSEVESFEWMKEMSIEIITQVLNMPEYDVTRNDVDEYMNILKKYIQPIERNAHDRRIIEREFCRATQQKNISNSLVRKYASL